MIDLNLVKKTCGLNKPVRIKDVELILGISNAYAKILLKSWIDSGEIKRFTKGIYYFPEKSMLFGEKPFDVDEILKDKYLGEKDAPKGYYSGLTLANMAKITTQVPVIRTIVTNTEKGNGRRVILGKVKIKVSKPRQSITKDNVTALSLLDLVSIAPKYSELTKEETIIKIQEYAQKLRISKQSVKNSLKAYPAKTSQELIMMGVYDVLI